MKILVTGACGFIGQHICEYYAHKGCNVVGVDVVNQAHSTGSYDVVCKDLLNDDMTEMYRAVAPDVIFHCAGNASVISSVEHPETDFEKNVMVLYRTLSAIKRAGISSLFVFMSSAAVYGNPSMLPISEDSLLSPISPYGLHKCICEDICTYYQRIHNVNIKIARIFSAYGEGLRKQIFWDMWQKYSKDGKIQLFGTGQETRDFIHIDDIVCALDIITRIPSDSTIFNIASGTETTIGELAHTFAKHLTNDEHTVSFNNIIKQGDPINWCADIRTLKSIGFKQTVSLEKGVERFAYWSQNSG